MMDIVLNNTLSLLIFFGICGAFVLLLWWSGRDARKAYGPLGQCKLFSRRSTRRWDEVFNDHSITDVSDGYSGGCGQFHDSIGDSLSSLSSLSSDTFSASNVNHHSF